jgi:hypothetical protein
MVEMEDKKVSNCMACGTTVPEGYEEMMMTCVV